MIKCPYCDIDFNPSYQACPKCNDYKTPQQERVRFFKQKAEELANDDYERKQIRQYLLDNGLSDVEADHLLDDAFSCAVANNRSYGCIRIVVGCGMLFFGGVATLILVSVLCFEAGILQHAKSLMILAIVGGGLIIGGLLAIMLGVHSLLSGKS